MNRIQFWVLTWSIIVVGPLFLTEIFLSHTVREDERKVVLLERLAQEGATYSNRWQQLAGRIYQLSQQDPALRDVLAHQQISVTPKASVNAAAPAADGPPTQIPAVAAPARPSP